MNCVWRFIIIRSIIRFSDEDHYEELKTMDEKMYVAKSNIDYLLKQLNTQLDRVNLIDSTIAKSITIAKLISPNQPKNLQRANLQIINDNNQKLRTELEYIHEYISNMCWSLS